MDLSKKDITILQDLAKEYMEVATLPVQEEKIKLWKSLNRGKMERPMVVIDQLPLHELNVNGELDCYVEDPFWRSIEFELRLSLYKWRHFPVDMVLDPFITIPKAIENSGFGIDVDREILHTDPDSDIVSQQYKRQINDMDDLEKIKDMTIVHHEETSQLWLEQASYIFDGIAPVRSSGGLQFHLGVWDVLSQLMGVENIYFDLIDRPQLLHGAASRLTDSLLAGIRQANELGVHNDIINTCHCSYIYTDELLPSSGECKGPYSKNVWAFGLAQLFSSVSPSVTEEFEIPYITKLAKEFGMIYYGCCERLDDRLDIVKKIPNLKKVSCSPWSDPYVFAENMGEDLVMSSKPNPAYLAADSVDYDAIKKDLLETLKAAKVNNVNLEFILKDISTVRYQPDRITKWANIAMEVVNQY
ncbi:MAG: hypothetical protein WBJ73_05335 [Caldicoprobacterales bacterium]